jgi:hypothetical protein
MTRCQVWATLLNVTRYPSLYLPGASNEKIVSDEEGVVVRELDMSMPGTPVPMRLHERVTQDIVNCRISAESIGAPSHTGTVDIQFMTKGGKNFIRASYDWRFKADAPAPMIEGMKANASGLMKLHLDNIVAQGEKDVATGVFTEAVAPTKLTKAQFQSMLSDLSRHPSKYIKAASDEKVLTEGAHFLTRTMSMQVGPNKMPGSEKMTWYEQDASLEPYQAGLTGESLGSDVRRGMVRLEHYEDAAGMATLKLRYFWSFMPNAPQPAVDGMKANAPIMGKSHLASIIAAAEAGL